MDALNLQYAQSDIIKGTLTRTVANLDELIADLTKILKARCPHIEYQKREYDDGHSRWYDYYVCKECSFDTRDKDYHLPLTPDYQILLDQRKDLYIRLNDSKTRLAEISASDKQRLVEHQSICPHVESVNFAYGSSIRKCTQCCASFSS